MISKRPQSSCHRTTSRSRVSVNFALCWRTTFSKTSPAFYLSIRCCRAIMSSPHLKAVIFDVGLPFLNVLQFDPSVSLADWRCGLPQSPHRHRRIRAGTWHTIQLYQLFHVSLAACFVPEISKTRVSYCCHYDSTRRGSNGAWQRFERGEIPLLTFYDQFGRDLSDTALGNTWYHEYCKQRGIGVYVVVIHAFSKPKGHQSSSTFLLTPRMSATSSKSEHRRKRGHPLFLVHEMRAFLG